MKLPYNIIGSDRSHLTPTLSKLEQLEIVEEELEIVKDLESFEVEDSCLLGEKEEFIIVL